MVRRCLGGLPLLADSGQKNTKANQPTHLIILSVESEILVMGKTSLNDLVYSFEPLKIVTPDPNHKVDEVELQKSIQKSKEMVEVIEEYKRKRAASNS